MTGPAQIKNRTLSVKEMLDNGGVFAEVDELREAINMAESVKSVD